MASQVGAIPLSPDIAHLLTRAEQNTNDPSLASDIRRVLQPSPEKQQQEEESIPEDVARKIQVLHRIGREGALLSDIEDHEGLVSSATSDKEIVDECVRRLRKSGDGGEADLDKKVCSGKRFTKKFYCLFFFFSMPR